MNLTLREKVYIPTGLKAVLATFIVVYLWKIFQLLNILPVNSVPIIALCIITGLLGGRIAGLFAGLSSFYIVFGYFSPVNFICWCLIYSLIGFVAGCFAEKDGKTRIIVAITIFAIGFAIWWFLSNSYWFIPLIIASPLSSSLWNEYFALVFNPFAFSFMLASLIANLAILLPFLAFNRK
jgi:hypothetical protein